jgi:hypothetical protein
MHSHWSEQACKLVGAAPLRAAVRLTAPRRYSIGRCQVFDARFNLPLAPSGSPRTTLRNQRRLQMPNLCSSAKDLLGYNREQLVEYLERHAVPGGFDISGLVGLLDLTKDERFELGSKLRYVLCVRVGLLLMGNSDQKCSKSRQRESRCTEPQQRLRR